MRAVLDTNVVASAILWSGSPRLLLQAARDNRIEIFTSTVMLAELTDILSRPKFARKMAAAGLTVDQLVDGYAALAASVRPAAMPRISPDPDDDMVIGTAIAAKAECIVTGDKALLSVIEHAGIRIVGIARAFEMIAERHRI